MAKLRSTREYYRSRSLVIVGHTWFSEGGDWRSIYLYFRDAEQRGQPVHLVDGRRADGLRQMLAAGLFAPRLLLNGFGSLLRWPCLLLLLWRADAWVYLHETEYTLRSWLGRRTLKAWLIRRILRRNPLLCVSRQAESLYREWFGNVHLHVVYEAVSRPEPSRFPLDRIHVMMVGSMDERKGVELFSRVADRCAQQHPDWMFHWVGGLSTRASLYRSANVCWHGWHPQPGALLEQAKVFFLSSVDDPCSLAALEALAAGKRCVAYRRTGIAELIESIEGCAVYEVYTAEAATAALSKCLSQSIDLVAVERRVRQTVGLRGFRERIDAVLTTAGTSAQETHP